MVKMKNIYYQLIPEKVFAILPQLEISMKDIPGFCPERLKELISIIAIHVHKDDDNWTPLKMEYLRAQVPQADRYISSLRFLRIIERSGYACIGKTSFNYRFTPAYKSKYIRFKLETPKLLRRNTEFGTSMKKRNSKKFPGQNQFLREMTIEKVSLDFIKRIEDAESYNYALSAITRILNGDIYYSNDDTSGRYHSNLTNMPKELRQFIRIMGKSLVNLDVKNCQPYLSILILVNPKKAAEFTKNPSFRMLLESLQVKQTEDVRLMYLL